MRLKSINKNNNNNYYKIDRKKTCECEFYVKLGYCSHIFTLEKLWENDDSVNRPKKGRIKIADKWPNLNRFN